MSSIDSEGMLVDSRVIHRRFYTIEHGRLDGVHAIVVHQTDARTATHTFNAYGAGGGGAHFLIEKNGLIYQTASLKKRCYHVGRHIKSKCLTIDKKTCGTDEMAKIRAMPWVNQVRALDAHERAKPDPYRYPVNSDSVGVELVGRHVDVSRYEVVTPLQNSSLQWLVSDLYRHFSLTSSDVYRHPQISYKHPGEASSAVWK
ncbi:peptidoglycan recognition protein family protein [Pseudomonas gingeri]|uniref:N-acetylmuramoyl-L-alanine amidase n=1 Tax=Pseudomonas gingeri TaxID=117681 RepID=A0A7Y8CM48_9PSED|nr:N-acetylmuramoyl-L-alanine amidase [Pseudomonas gingeri]NWB29307.1 N-acetylmuramoyl-L-alanine amidase [Pseudomonas gingeri]NWC35210.1 N-acetylmuramoyl-L-alanine amidase [Pseudomonas gingeri]NWD47292.1 N-acetylmuramoyl-L-alanine amidase [Pseudomonas gingeri]